MNRSKLFILFTLAEILLLLVLFLYTYTVQSSITNKLTAKSELVHQLELTDFAIWTEARYTRNPSQADFFSPFQELPGSFEHFPAGSIIAPVVSIERVQP